MHIHIHNIRGNLVNNIDDFNERTLFFIKNIPLTLYSRKGWCWLCVRGELETGIDCYILTQSSSGHSSTFAFWLGCSTVGHWGPKAPLSAAGSQLDILSATDFNCNWNSKWHVVCGYIFFLTSTVFLWVYASATFDRMHLFFSVLLLIYTGASLDWRLGRGSICYISGY